MVLREKTWVTQVKGFTPSLITTKELENFQKASYSLPESASISLCPFSPAYGPCQCGKWLLPLCPFISRSVESLLFLHMSIARQCLHFYSQNLSKRRKKNHLLLLFTYLVPNPLIQQCIWVPKWNPTPTITQNLVVSYQPKKPYHNPCEILTLQPPGAHLMAGIILLSWSWSLVVWGVCVCVSRVCVT